MCVLIFDCFFLPHFGSNADTVRRIETPDRVPIDRSASCQLTNLFQSFRQMGFAATEVFERASPIADPMYHNSGRFIHAWSRSITHASIRLGDLSDRDGYDFDQIKSIAKIQVRSL